MFDETVLLAENRRLEKALKYCQDDKLIMKNQIYVLETENARLRKLLYDAYGMGWTKQALEGGK